MELSISEKKKAKKVRKRENLTFSILNYTFFFLITLICAYPFYYLIINSISNNELSALGQIRFFPQEIHFENYSQVLQLKGLPLAATVSVARTVIGTRRDCLSFSLLRLHVYPRKNVETKILVSLCRDYNVFQCRVDSIIHHDEDIRFNE